MCYDESVEKCVKIIKGVFSMYSSNSTDLTTGQVAEILGLTLYNVRQLTNEGELKSYKTSGGHRRYTLSSVYKYKGKRGLENDDNAIIFMFVANKDEEDRVKVFCTVAKWKYEIIVQGDDIESNKDGLASLITKIEECRINRLILGPCSNQEELLYSCIVEIAKHNNVEVYDLYQLEECIAK